MKKLRLEPEDLSVTTFEVDAESLQDKGTVEALELDPTRQTRCETCRTLCLPYC